MAKFDLSIDTILKHEGGYVNNPTDPGGETNFGISKRSYPNVDIATLTIEKAKEIYRKDFWFYDEIESQVIATKIFDIAVNMGAMPAHRMLQEALKNLGFPLVVDGVLGPLTKKATNDADMGRLLQEVRALQAERYAKIVINKPSQETFLRGWMRRAVS